MGRREIRIGPCLETNRWPLIVPDRRPRDELSRGFAGQGLAHLDGFFPFDD